MSKAIAAACNFSWRFGLAILIGSGFQALSLSGMTWAQTDDSAPLIRIGIIGLDTSHSIAFTKVFNADSPPKELAGCRVVVAYPHGSKDIESSVSRIPKYTQDIQKYGVEIVDSIEELLERVDAVLLETNDGRPHLEQVIQVLAAKKPVFVDKPIAASLADAIEILERAEKAGVPLFSSSSLRFAKGTMAVRDGSIGKVIRCQTHSPASIEKTHPDLFWYGIHGCESLFTVMGMGCMSVKRMEEDGKIKVVGEWPENRIGTYREGKGYGGEAVGDMGSAEVGSYDGYEPLVRVIAKFFRTAEPPVSAAETIEIYAFMEAADESKRQGGAEVKLATVISKAREVIRRRNAAD